ncbi:hypothetical protein K0M31_011109 [Melipona bicolor]|uniref:Uncharacterized protein n=1 Tax=Melipona bicolor TaxID=60889 RepID=A0AA40G8W8_9HYME|nr:hypothetical protein K0M31_011109 [Melipona bicolor]
MTSLLKCVAKDWATVETRTGRETMMNVARISRKTTIGCLMLCQLVVTSYMFLRLSTLKQSDNKLVYRSYFPYNASVSPNYELTMIAQVIGGLCGALTYISVDTFIVMLVLHACGQFSNLKDDLGNIHSCDRKDLQARLKKIVEKHNYIVGYVLKSTNVADTAYNCEWYSLPPKYARLLIIIMCRARASPLKLTAGKFCWFTVLLYSQHMKYP